MKAIIEHLDAELLEHARSEGLTGTRRWRFLKRGGHSSVEYCRLDIIPWMDDDYVQTALKGPRNG